MKKYDFKYKKSIHSLQSNRLVFQHETKSRYQKNATGVMIEIEYMEAQYHAAFE